jgi:uncharacterized phage protein gp47/JayE
VIPVGTICSTDPAVEPVVEFLTTEEKTVIGGSYADIPVEAKNAGEEGNVEAGKVIYLPQEIPNITITNPNPIAGGTEEEDDDTLRKRIVLRWYGVAYGGCEESFRSMALEVTGVAEAQAVACYAGPGTVKILIWSRNETGSLVPASDTLVETVQDYLDEYKPICTKVLVAQPTGVLQDVFIYLDVESGYTFAVISENVKAAVMAFFDDLDVGDDLIVAKLLAACMAVTGVKDIKIGKPKDNVSCTALEKIMLGRVAITTKAWENQYVTW